MSRLWRVGCGSLVLGAGLGNRYDLDYLLLLGYRLEIVGEEIVICAAIKLIVHGGQLEMGFFGRQTMNTEDTDY